MTASEPPDPGLTTRRRQQILFVTARAYQTFAGGDGAHLDALMRHLARDHDVTGLSTSLTRGRLRPLARLVYGNELASAWRFRGAMAVGRWRLLVAPAMLLIFLRDAFRFVRSRSLGEAWTWDEEPGEVTWLRKQINGARPDIVVFCFEAAAMIARLNTDARTLAMVGFLPNRAYRLAANGDQVRTTDMTSLLMTGLRQANAVAVNNLADQTWWNGQADATNFAVLAGMSSSGFQALLDSAEPVVLFVGNKTEPNIAGLTWFLAKVWPKVRLLVPSARLRIVGRVADSAQSNPVGVDKVGLVDDLDAEYARARVVAVPLTIGSAGVKTKLVEAIAHGRTFVATSVAIEPEHRGRLETCGEVTDDPDAFAATVARLIEDDTFRRTRQEQSRHVYEALFSAKAAYGELDRWIAQGARD